MRQNRIFRGPRDLGGYFIRSSGANTEVYLIRQRLLRANHGMMQNICRHRQESDDRLMPQRNNGIAIYSWSIRDWQRSNEGM
jgi:hypothetical protein